MNSNEDVEDLIDELSREIEKLKKENIVYKERCRSLDHLRFNAADVIEDVLIDTGDLHWAISNSATILRQLRKKLSTAELP